MVFIEVEQLVFHLVVGVESRLAGPFEMALEAQSVEQQLALELV